MQDHFFFLPYFSHNLNNQLSNTSTMVAVQVDDVVTMQGQGRWTLSFEILAEPQAQEGPRLKWRGIRLPRLYDPSAKANKTWKRALKEALCELGINADEVPIFGEAGVELIHVNLIFMWSQPDQKDLDNMIKFDLDAYEGLLYTNDKTIYSITSKKAYSASLRVSATFTMVPNIRNI
jgi:Holliday junction resolvase RusA-like endonuclease